MEKTDPLAEGKGLIARGKPAEAIQVLAPAAERDRDDARLLCELGIALKLSGRVEEARTTLETAWRIAPPGDPDLAQRAGFILGLTYGDLRRMEDAIAMFEKVRGVAPETPLGDTALYYVQAYRSRVSGPPPA